MKKRIEILVLTVFLLVVASCQTEEEDTFQDELLVENNEDVKILEDIEDFDFRKSSAFLHCSRDPFPPGYRVLYYTNSPTCEPNYSILYLGLYNAAIITPIGLPLISRAGAGCDDNYCIWIVGNNFEPNAYVDIRTATGSSIIGTYRGSNRVQYVNSQGQDVITLRLNSALERNEFANRGLRIWVVNPEARKWADGRTVRRPYTPGDSDPIDPDECNPICP
ncbi:hypothetical protein [Aquimarina sp. 2304DJ70-9]|uniref:hypothetical protein n=1 Tax=Aquimarina penaris TaxID=3231044 RepID=UPI0034635235